MKKAERSIDKINSYLNQNPNSKTLKQIIGYQKIIQESNNDQEIFKLAVSLTYYLDIICNPNKAIPTSLKKVAKKQAKALKILFKGHKCPATCYCQKPAKTWQEKIQQGTKLTELAEKKIKEAQELRVKETTKLLFKNPQSFFNSK